MLDIEEFLLVLEGIQIKALEFNRFKYPKESLREGYKDVAGIAMDDFRTELIFYLRDKIVEQRG